MKVTNERPQMKSFQKLTKYPTDEPNPFHVKHLELLIENDECQ